jgi:hypothetical protein
MFLPECPESRRQCLAIAAAYRCAPELSIDAAAVSALIMDAATRLPFRIVYTDSDPYNDGGYLAPNLDRVCAEVAATGTLYVYALGSRGVLSPEVNRALRAVHDWDHVVHRAGFDFEGERAATRVAAARNPALAAWYASEVVGQASVTLATGVFPAQRLAAGLERYL